MRSTWKKIFSVMLLLFLVFNTSSAFAKEGDFYKKHKKKFDEAQEDYLSETYIDDVVKKYDSKTNTFECGTFNFTCFSTAPVYEAGLSFTNMAYGLMKNVVKDPQMIIDDKGINEFKKGLTTLSWTLLPLFLFWHIAVMAMRRFGDPDDYAQAINERVIALFSAASFLALYNSIFEMILNIQAWFLTDILNSGLSQDALKLTLFLWSPQYSIIIVLFILLCLIVFGLAVLYRFVALAFMFMVGPLAVVTMMNEEFNYFKVWLRYIISNIVTFVLQAMAFVMCMQALTGKSGYVNAFTPEYQAVMAIAYVIVLSFFSLSIPFLLGNMGSSSGVAKTFGRISRVALKR
ncbi:hypothetical protein QK289_14325 [Exiguobacterium antarcticum]|uniref:Uncharacterized protein n=1 Tax=Exiguobacterium antarcticum TaxID=132920 RepID=A0ABT6R5Y5_9BACL|nr:conjugal transfer protein TrbL family protein [Exiguobacterium antarcticum]MDI3236187.1 hypothetical protein [Exiguobacterium antarcticum]